jgi:hypothetical protein
MATAGHETDIDLVLVTGAGASRQFGVNGAKLPLMGDWADFLAEQLWRLPAADEITGLKKGMTGPQFEARLGQFLNEVEGFYQAEGLIRPSSKFPLNPPIIESQLLSWYQTAKSQFQQITATIHRSVYDQFNANKLNWMGAAKAYKELLDRMKITRASSIVYATTNYDALGEQALSELRYIPDCGEPRRYGTAQNTLDVSNLLDGLPRNVPMLHLHGKVGWLRRADDPTNAYFSETTAYDPNFGLPIIMLPDPQKTYAGDDVLSILWTQFEAALRRARRVFVLGHSLADRLVVSALATQVQPPHDRVAISVLGDGHGSPDPAAESFVNWIKDKLPRAKIIPMVFGDPLNFRGDTVDAWMSETKELGIP